MNAAITITTRRTKEEQHRNKMIKPQTNTSSKYCEGNTKKV
jgi:hypothetical protein